MKIGVKKGVLKMLENKIKITAKSLDIALIRAAGQLGVTQNNLSYEVIHESKKGFFSFFIGKSKVEILAWRNNQGTIRGKNTEVSKSFSQNYKLKNSKSKKKFSSPIMMEKKEKVVKLLKSTIEKIISTIFGENIQIVTELQKTRLILNIKHPSAVELIQKNHRFIGALEHILRKMLQNQKIGFTPIIFVDAEGTRLEHERKLMLVARELAAQVKEKQQPLGLDYRSSYDRKIIHMALDHDDKVYTKSIWSGDKRKLMVFPTDNLPTSKQSVDSV